MSVSPGAGTRLDPWFGSYAARTHGMKASETRALFAVANRPEVVSLAGGMPNIAGLPLEIIAKITADLIATEGTVALQYGNGQGSPILRERTTEVMALEGIAVHPDDVVVTTGSQQALDLVTRTSSTPGTSSSLRHLPTLEPCPSFAPIRPTSSTSRWMQTD